MTSDVKRDDCLGRIAWIRQLPDPQGGNPKDRRCVVIKRVHDGKTFLLVAASTEFDSDNLGPYEERLKSGNSNQPSQLSFTEPTVAKCFWLAVVAEDDCEFCGGPVSSVQLEVIIQKATKAIEAGVDRLVRDDRKRLEF